MKLTPLSMAVRMMRMASSSLAERPMWPPPMPIADTFSPVRPSVR
jgi:hypothetical protein